MPRVDPWDHVVVERDERGVIRRVMAYDAQHDKGVHLPLTAFEMTQDVSMSGGLKLTFHPSRVRFVDFEEEPSLTE